MRFVSLIDDLGKMFVIAIVVLILGFFLFKFGVHLYHQLFDFVLTWMG